jgi:hypothetical protein
MEVSTTSKVPVIVLSNEAKELIQELVQIFKDNFFFFSLICLFALISTG